MKSEKTKRYVGGCLALLLIGWLLTSLYDTWHFRRALPEKIGVTGLARTGSDTSLLMILIPVAREGCGGAIFQLTDETRQAIETQGLAFFADARQGRDPASNSYYSYKEWQETPVPQAWVGNGTWAGLACAGFWVPPSVIGITAAARKNGAYYTTASEAELLVIPSLGIVVFTYFG